MLALLPSCESASNSSSSAVAQSAVRAPSEPTASEPWIRRQTTNPRIALRNLDSQIAARLRRHASGGQPLPERVQLVHLLLQRLRFTGSFEDFDRSDAISKSVLAEFPRQGAALRLRATHLSAVHRFDEALPLLRTAAELGEKTVDVDRGWIQLAQGKDLETLLVSAQRWVTQAPSVPRLSLLAAVTAALGKFETADAHYQRALDVNLDVSPFLICQILFQRGVMWAENAAQPQRALPLYREAVKRLPYYVSAQVHLAELQADSGKLKEAIGRLRAIAPKTHDPEPAGLLSELLERAGKPGAAQLLQTAERAYEQLLRKYRAGFLDHASEFFAGPGRQAARGLKLAQQNLVLRDTARARRLLLEAASVAGDSGVLCATAASSHKWAKRNPSLRAALKQYASGCPKSSAP